MRNTLPSLLVLAFVYCLFPLSALAQGLPEGLQLRTYKDQMHYISRFSETGPDSVYMPDYKEIRRFHSDSLFYYAATQGVEALKLELYHYQTGIVPYLTKQQLRQEQEKLDAALRRYKSRDFQREGRVTRIGLMEDPVERLNAMLQLAKSREWRGDAIGQLLILRSVMEQRIVDMEYSLAFRMAQELLLLLDTPEGQQFENKHELYFTIGDLYYRFRDYERAIPLLEKALTEPGFVPAFWQRGNLRAHNTLGVYYRNKGDLMRSDQYFISMLKSEDMVKYRPMYDAIAIANLGRNQLQRKAYEQALALYRVALPQSLQQGDEVFSAGILTKMGEAYLGIGHVERAKAMIDSSLAIILPKPFENRSAYQGLYTLMSQYYSHTGDFVMADVYRDSSAAANRRYEDEFSTLTLMRAEQEQLEAQLQHKEKVLQVQRSRLVVAVVIACMFLITAVLVFRSYRKKHAAYQALVIKLRQWADNDMLGKDEDRQLPDAKELELVERIHSAMLEEQLYKNCELNLELLAQRLNVNRETVSKAINRSTGKHFAHFLNEYRVKDAVKMMARTKYQNIGLDDIYFQVGFNSRRTFTRAFKQHTGMSPSEFRYHS